MSLDTDADTIVSSANGSGGTAAANADFSHTFTFALSGPVFNLPTGYTAGSPDAHIVGNQVVASVPGDFNGDGLVNAADYVTWRKGTGTSYTPEQYNLWRAHFGQTASSGAGATGVNATARNVPEPATFPLVTMSCVAAGLFTKRFRVAHMTRRSCRT